jgi:hypothetical protein
MRRRQNKILDKERSCLAYALFILTPVAHSLVSVLHKIFCVGGHEH